MCPIVSFVISTGKDPLVYWNGPPVTWTCDRTHTRTNIFTSLLYIYHHLPLLLSIKYCLKCSEVLTDFCRLLATSPELINCGRGFDQELLTHCTGNLNNRRTIRSCVCVCVCVCVYVPTPMSAASCCEASSSSDGICSILLTYISMVPCATAPNQASAGCVSASPPSPGITQWGGGGGRGGGCETVVGIPVWGSWPSLRAAITAALSGEMNGSNCWGSVNR